MLESLAKYLVILKPRYPEDTDCGSRLEGLSQCWTNLEKFWACSERSSGPGNTSLTLV